MKNKKIILLVVLIIIILGLFAELRQYNEKAANEGLKTDGQMALDHKVIVPHIEGNKDDLVSFSIKPGQEVSGKLTATGKLSQGYFFEANVGVNILDKNKKILRQGNGMSTEDWTTHNPLTFSTNLDFTGLTKGPGYIELLADNPSGMPEYDKHILIPIIIL